MFLIFYNLFLYLFSPVVILTLFIRMLLGKEHNKKYLEKLGFYNNIDKKRNKLIWFHACSVGEVKSIQSISQDFLNRKYEVLITTSTLLSENYVKKNFSNKIYHQFLPIDFNLSIRKFLMNCKPNIAVFVESEIWPNLINNCRQMNIPLVLLQASFSDKSLKKWLIFKKFFKKLLETFDIIIAQSKVEKSKLFKFANIVVHDVYNLKNSSSKLHVKINQVNKIKENLRKSFIIVALSTHMGEEKLLLNSLKELTKKIKDIILIIQPRHPKRANEVIKIIKSYDFKFKQRSISQYPLKDTQVYLADTFGESGTLIFSANLVILGGTLVPIGGPNIIEPAQMSKCIIVGKYFSKIKDTVNIFKNKQAVKVLENNSNLSKIIIDLYNDKNTLKSIGKKAFSITQSFPKKENEIIKKIISLERKNDNPKILVQR